MVCALRGLLREAIIFPSFRNLRTLLLANCFCPETMQSDPNVFNMSSLFSKAVLLSRMSSFSPDPGLSQPNSEENVAQRFPSFVFPFHLVLFIEEQVFAGLSSSKFSYPLQKYPDKSLTQSV